MIGIDEKTLAEWERIAAEAEQDLAAGRVDRDWVGSACVEAVPSLASEVRRLRAELEEARGALREIEIRASLGAPAVEAPAVLSWIAARASSSVGGGDAGKGEGKP